MNDSLLHSPSPLTSLRHGYLNKTLLSTELYKKHAPSHIDPMFAECLTDIMTDDDPRMTTDTESTGVVFD